MALRTRSSHRVLALAALILFLVVPARSCARRATSPPTTDPPAALADTPQPAPAPTADPPAPGPTITYRYPPYRYHVEGPDARLVAAGFNSSAHYPFPAEYWFIGGDPVTIEIRFAETVRDPAAAIRQIRQRLPGALVHEERHEAERVFVRATLPPGQYAIDLVDAGGTEDLWGDHRILILDKGRPFRLMRWEPGGTPAVLGEYVLPTRFGPYAAALETEEGEAFFLTVAFEWENSNAVCLWRWQSGAQPPLTLFGGLWEGARVFPRSDDLLVQTLLSLFVLDRSGDSVARLVEDRYPHGVAVGPGGEIAVFLVRGKGQGEFELELTVFTAALETYRTWDAICPQGRFSDGIPDVQPIWYGDEIFFLALDDRHHDPPTYQLMAIDVRTGSVRRALGPFVRGYRVGGSHYALREHEGGNWALWDATTCSLRTLLSARDVGELWSPWPVAVVADWVVFRVESGLLAWHPSMGMKHLGSGMAVVKAGEAFLWWTAVSGDR